MPGTVEILHALLSRLCDFVWVVMLQEPCRNPLAVVRWQNFFRSQHFALCGYTFDGLTSNLKKNMTKNNGLTPSKRLVFRVLAFNLSSIMLLDLPSPVVFNRSRSSEHFLATSFASTDRSIHFHPSSILSHDTIHINRIKPPNSKISSGIFVPGE